MEQTRTVHVLVHGRVQGVGFRAWVQHHAELHRLKGWVRNRRDGAVEAVFSGPSKEVEAVLAACRRGPAGARVDTVETAEEGASTVARPASGRFELWGTV
jgi:acylphosphatase